MPMDKKSQLKQSIQPYEEYLVPTFRALKPLKPRYQYQGFEGHQFKLVNFFKQSKKGLGGRFYGKNYILLYKGEAKGFSRQKILEVYWNECRKETELPDPRFTIYINDKKKPNVYYPKHSFYLSDNLIQGLMILVELQQNWFFREANVTKLEFVEVNENKIRTSEDEFRKAINYLTTDDPDECKIVQANSYLKRFNHQKPVSPLEQDRILDSLTMKFGLNYLTNKGTYLPFLTLDRALRNTNYTTRWVVRNPANYTYWGSIYLMERDPDDIVDLKKELYMELVDTILLMQTKGFDEFKKIIGTRSRKPLNDYMNYFCDGNRKWNKFFKDNYGSLETFLNPKVSINIYKNNPALIYRESHK